MQTNFDPTKPSVTPEPITPSEPVASPPPRSPASRLHPWVSSRLTWASHASRAALSHMDDVVSVARTMPRLSILALVLLLASGGATAADVAGWEPLSSARLRQAIQGAPSDGQVITWSSASNRFTYTTPASGGLSSVTTSGLIDGDGTSGDAVRLITTGASTGETIRYNGSAWTIDSLGLTDTTGSLPLTRIDNTGASIGEYIRYDGTNWSADSIATSDLTGTIGLSQISTTGAASGETIRYDGSAWQVVPLGFSDLSGSASLTQISTTGASTGEAIRYDGSAWQAASIAMGDVTGSLGLSRLDTTGATSGQVVSYNGSVWTNATVAISSTSGDLPTDRIDTTGASSGYVVRYDGSDWVAAQLALSDTSGVLGLARIDETGAATGEVIYYDGTDWIADVLPIGSTSGDLPLTRLDTTGASTGEVVYYDGTDWTASTLALSATTGTLAYTQLYDTGVTSGQVLRHNGTDWTAATLALSDTTGSMGYDRISGGSAVLGDVLQWDGSAWSAVALDGSDLTGVVTSWNGRTGAVSPQSGDYTAAQVGAQSADATLTALAALSGSGVVYTTGSDTYSLLGYTQTGGSGDENKLARLDSSGYIASTQLTGTNMPTLQSQGATLSLTGGLTGSIVGDTITLDATGVGGGGGAGTKYLGRYSSTQHENGSGGQWRIGWPTVVSAVSGGLSYDGYTFTASADGYVTLTGVIITSTTGTLQCVVATSPYTGGSDANQSGTRLMQSVPAGQWYTVNLRVYMANGDDLTCIYHSGTLDGSSYTSKQLTVVWEPE